MLLLYSNRPQKRYVSAVYIAADMFKIMCILFIKKFFCININPNVNEKIGKVIEIPFEYIAIQNAIPFKISQYIAIRKSHPIHIPTHA